MGHKKAEREWRQGFLAGILATWAGIALASLDAKYGASCAGELSRRLRRLADRLDGQEGLSSE